MTLAFPIEQLSDAKIFEKLIGNFGSPVEPPVEPGHSTATATGIAPPPADRGGAPGPSATAAGWPRPVRRELTALEGVEC